MAAALIFSAGVGAALIGVLVGVLVHWFDARLPVQGRRLIVNLTDGSALRGILVRSRGSWLVLEDAELLRIDTGAVPGAVRIDGTAYIERPRVLFVQVLP
jgi:small nuclear ribonucleoprotein (snRNP)-like protein